MNSFNRLFFERLCPFIMLYWFCQFPSMLMRFLWVLIFSHRLVSTIDFFLTITNNDYAPKFCFLNIGKSLHGGVRDGCWRICANPPAGVRGAGLPKRPDARCDRSAHVPPEGPLETVVARPGNRSRPVHKQGEGG